MHDSYYTRLEDYKFDLIKSSTLQKLALMYEHNMATKSFAVIFVQNHGGNQSNDQKATTAHRLFEDELNFQDVHTFRNLSQNQTIEQFKSIKSLADNFEK